MSSENGDQALRESLAEAKHEESQQKELKIGYTRELLLSLGELYVCKRLPEGFDRSLLSEFEDTSNTAFERQRSLGGLRPQNRTESSGGYSGGSSGRWDTRSSGSSEKDADSQGDRDLPDPRRVGNQPRRSWQQPEHDGLLGSGAFARPSGYPGTYAPGGRGNSTYQLTRSSEPYQPPRPYKAVPYSRKDNADSFNDETFGSSECTSEDKAEEERKRRVCFESMRKEQHKAFQDKQKQKPESQREKVGNATALMLELPEEDLTTRKDDQSDVFGATYHGQNDSSRLPSNVQGFVSRPVVPPGFASARLEQNPVVQSANTLTEAVHAVVENNISVDNDVEKKISSTTGMSAFNSWDDLGNKSYKSSGLQEGNDVEEDDVVRKYCNEKESTPEIVCSKKENCASSILEKLFGTAVAKNSRNALNLEHQGIKDNSEALHPATFESSKFANLVLENDKKPMEDLSPRNLQSLIVSNQKVGSQDTVIIDDNTVDVMLPTSSLNDDNIQKLLVHPAGPSFKTNNHSDRQDVSPNVLTCEDLEQLILSDIKDIGSSSHSVAEHWTAVDSKTEEHNLDVDDRASQHLLSLLTKGTNPMESMTVKQDSLAFAKPALSDLSNASLGVSDETSIQNLETIQSSEAVSTLGSLFGAAFMSDLHSVRAPLSVRKGPIASTHEIDHAPRSMTLSEGDDQLVHSTSGTTVFSQSEEAAAQQSSSLLPGQSSLNGLKNAEKNHEEGLLAIRLREEDSLFSVSDPLNSLTSDSAHGNFNSTDRIVPEETVKEFSNPLISTLFRERQQMGQPGLHGRPLHGSHDHFEVLPPKIAEEINNSLLNTLFKEGQQRGRPDFRGPSLHGPADLIETADPLHHGRIMSQVPQNQIRPLPPQIEPHTDRNPHMRFIGRESLLRPELHHMFPPNLTCHHAFPSMGSPQFDSPPLHPLLQHIMPKDFPPHHPVQGMPRGSRPAMHGYAPEMNNLAGLAFTRRQQNYPVPGVGLPGSFVGAGDGNGNPEVLQRLIEMELRGGNQKQIHLKGSGQIPRIFSPELGMGSMYR